MTKRDRERRIMGVTLTGCISLTGSISLSGGVSESLTGQLANRLRVLSALRSLDL